MRYLTYLILTFWISSCSRSGKIILIENRKSDYVIVLPKDADLLLHEAGMELRDYLSYAGDFQLPIVEEGEKITEKAILIGKKYLDREAGLPEEGIQYQVTGNRLILAGGNSRSTLYAVYTFLENELGCRFYAPDAEMVPNLKSVRINRNSYYSYIPAITTRTVHSRLFYENQKYANKQKVSSEAFPGYVPAARVHTFHVFLPEYVFYKNHPEYFALREGRRLPTQLCLTNEDVYRIVKDSVSAMLLRYPDARVISVSQDDNQQYCQCTACMEINNREGSPSGSVLHFVNRMAAEFPDKIISTLAYQYTRKAPAHIKPASNVLITLCSIECDRSAPISEKCLDFSTDLEEWGKITNHIRIWDYTTQFTNFLAPFPNLYTLQPNIQLFRENHARWIFEQHSHQPSELFELRSYLTAKLLWDPELDVDSLIHDFCAGYYAEAGPFVEKYITTIHQEMKKDPDFFLFLYGDPSQAFSSFLRPELLKQYDEWFNQAIKMVERKPDMQKRVRTGRLGVDFAILEASRKQAGRGFSGVLIHEDGSRSVPEDLKSRLDQFQSTCHESNISLMNEMGFTVEEYINSYKKMMERALKINLAINKKVILATPPKKYANEDPQTLTDGAMGGSSFFANWLGFDGHDMEATLDLEEIKSIEEISVSFLQVTNHIVFFPLQVNFYYSADGKNFIPAGEVQNQFPLTQKSKVNDTQAFTTRFPEVKSRYIRIVADNMDKAPVWHHGAGLSTWIFADEIEVR